LHCGERPKIDKQTTEDAASRNTDIILLGSTRGSSRQRARASKIARTTRATQKFAERLWNDKNFIGPRIFYFAAGCVTADIDISSTRIEGTEDITRLVRNRLGSWKGRLCGGSVRRWRRFWLYLGSLLATDARRDGRWRNWTSLAPSLRPSGRSRLPRRNWSTGHRDIGCRRG